MRLREGDIISSGKLKRSPERLRRLYSDNKQEQAILIAYCLRDKALKKTERSNYRWVRMIINQNKFKDKLKVINDKEAIIYE